jgi:hypothetical protein
MFLRFVISETDTESHQALGVFQAIFRLRDKGSLTEYEEAHLEQVRNWFNRSLEKPLRFTNAKPPYYRKRQNGISWFKDSAHEHISKIREITAILQSYGVPVQMIKTTRPGYIVYEDEFQIVAVPFSKSKV